LRDSQSDDREKTTGKKKENPDDKKDDTPPEAEYTLKDLARELKSLPAAPRSSGRGAAAAAAHRDTAAPGSRPAGAGISLSGLLNAIDGVASAEGRVLIMTTNHPEKLDAALVRPGRIDRKVEFRRARTEQIAELFLRMYAAGDQVPDIEPRFAGGGGAAAAAAGADEKSSLPPPPPPSSSGPHPLSQTELEALAREFASLVPAGTFTPAEIQNHLMQYKKAPRTAVLLAAQWVRELLEEKELEGRARERAVTDGDE
jgi:chaperone BCS1